MDKILEQYFVQNNELVLTNIGSLHLSKKPATWIGGTLHAPELTITFSINNTKLLIGEIVHVLLKDGIVASDGYVDHLKAKTVTVAGLDSYFTATHLGRLAYAKFA